MAVDERDLDDEFEPTIPADTIDWQLWPIAGVVAKRLGISKRELAQMVNEQEITRYRAKDRTWRFRPADVDAIIRTTRMGSKDIASSEIDPAVVASDAKTRGLESAAMTQAVRYLVESLAAEQKHVERMVELMGKPIEKALEVLEKTCATQSGEVERLSKVVAEQRDAATQADNDRFIRELAVRDIDNDAKRKDALTELIVKRAGPLLLAKATGKDFDVAQVLGLKPKPKAEPTNGHNGPTQDQVLATIQLLQSVRAENPELFAGLKEAEGFFTEDQRRLVDTIIGAGPAPTPPAQDTTTKEGSPCEKATTDA